MPDFPITPVICKDCGQSLAVLQEAHKRGIAASYHPRGGHSPKGWISLTHTVYLACIASVAEDIKHAAKEL